MSISASQGGRKNPLNKIYIDKGIISWGFIHGFSPYLNVNPTR